MENKPSLSPLETAAVVAAGIVETVAVETVAAVDWAARSYAGSFRKFPRSTTAVTLALAAGIQANVAYGNDPADNCMDADHPELQQVYVAPVMNSLPDTVEAALDEVGLVNYGRSWSNVVDEISDQRGYTITLSGFENANQGQSYMEYDEDGELEQTITPGTYCVQVPGPKPFGFEVADDNDSLASLSTESFVPVDVLEQLNPQLADDEGLIDPNKTIPEGTAVRLNDTYDTSLILRPTNGNLMIESNGDADLRQQLAIANVMAVSTGEAIRDGDAAFLPPVQTSWMTAHDLDIYSVIAEYDAQGEYSIQTKPAEPVVEPSPAPSETSPLALNNAQNEIIESLGRDEQKTQFIRDLVTAAMNLRANGARVNPAAMVSQAIVESNWGNSQLSSPENNNLFGIKAAEGTPQEDIVYFPTQEFENGQYVWVDAAFRRYDTLEEGLQGYVDFIAERPHFADALEYTDDLSQYVAHLLNGNLRYATAPDYQNTIETVAANNRLEEIFAAAN